MRLKELGMAGPQRRQTLQGGPEKEANTRVMRTKANCLQVCKKGPIAVVYPEGDSVCVQHLIVSFLVPAN